MQIKCIHTSYKDTPELSIRYSAYLNSTFNITKNKIYTVYAIRYTARNETLYLIQDDYYMPVFYSVMLFEIMDSQLPYEEWHFGKHEVNQKDYYMLGSKEMIASCELVDSIMLHDNSGLLYFENWRALIDRQYE